MIVNLTPRDVQVLAKHLGCDVDGLLKVVGFYQTGMEDEAEQRLIDERMVFPALHTHKGPAYLGLLKHQGGRCVFLQDDKCVVYPARPRICQSFPYTFDEKDRGASIGITAFASSSCPGIGQGSTVNVQKVKNLGRQVLLDTRGLVAFAREWNRAAEKDPDACSPSRLLAAMLAFGIRAPSKNPRKTKGRV